MKRPSSLRALSLAALLVVTLPPNTVRAQAPGNTAAQVPSDAEIKAILKQRVESGTNTGIIAGVIDRDGRQRVVSYGTSGIAGVPLDANAVFEIGSLTKTFTATILADMVLRGEIALDDAAQKYLPCQ